MSSVVSVLEGVLAALLGLVGTPLVYLLVRARTRLPAPQQAKIQSDLTKDETELLNYSAVRLAKLIRERKMSSVQVVQTYIKRIREVNGMLNLMVRDRFDEALKEAKAVDDRIARSDFSADTEPLLGVPVTIKESFAVKGMPCTAAYMARKNVVADADATVVARLRKAGAIVLGVTNVSELLLWLETNSSLYGRALNPHDPERTTGGSSGGEGGLLGAGASVIGIGSDIGGSIRYPASFNGVFGHKPTAAIVPQTGHFPPFRGPHAGLDTYGPLCRFASDLYPMLRIMAGPDFIDMDATSPFAVQDPATVSLKDVHVLAWESLPVMNAYAVDDAVKGAIKAAFEHLTKKTGCEALPSARPHAMIARTLDLWSAMIAQNSVPGPSEIITQDDGGFSPLIEMFKALFGTSTHTLATTMTTFADKMQRSPAQAQLVQMAEQLRSDLTTLLGRKGILLLPVFPTVAPYHGYPLLRPSSFAYCGLINVLGFPSTAVPITTTPSGVPVGIQVVSAQGNDHICIAVAMELERAFGGWIRPKVRPLRSVL